MSISPKAMIRFATALVELVKVDLELRWRAGQCWGLDEYCRRYPLLGGEDTLPIDLIYEAYRVAFRYRAAVSLEEFCRRYPRQRERRAG